MAAKVGTGMGRIGLLFLAKMRRKLFREALAQEGFSVAAPRPSAEGHLGARESGPHRGRRQGGPEFAKDLLDLKNREAGAFSFLPILVAQPYQEPASPWLSAGFDDVFPLPLVKPLLLVRVRSLAQDPRGDIGPLPRPGGREHHRLLPLPPPTAASSTPTPPWSTCSASPLWRNLKPGTLKRKDSARKRHVPSSRKRWNEKAGSRGLKASG